MRISDWSSDVCSSDLSEDVDPGRFTAIELAKARQAFAVLEAIPTTSRLGTALSLAIEATGQHRWHAGIVLHSAAAETVLTSERGKGLTHRLASSRSEEHTSELQSLMRISYAVFCLKKKIKEHKQL